MNFNPASALDEENTHPPNELQLAARPLMTFAFLLLAFGCTTIVIAIIWEVRSVSGRIGLACFLLDRSGQYADQK